MAARELGLVEQTLRNWVKASAAGKLTALVQASDAEQMELSQAARGNARLKMHVDILKSDGVLALRCAVKYAWIDCTAPPNTLPDLCEVLAVSISGYPCLAPWWQARPQPADGPAGRGLDENIHAEVKGCLWLVACTVNCRAIPSHRDCAGSSG